ncbi:MAG: VOC family protein [Ignavibacteria bacterium]|nr:VOC family protein [Ignavibacteria bacterium]
MKIKEIEILTDSIPETENFYSDVLGFKKINTGSGSISYRTGKSVLIFNESDNLKPKYHFAFNIPCNKLTEAFDFISERIDIIKNPDDDFITDFVNWNAKAFYFYDNNRNILEFIVRYDLNNESDKIFNSKSVQSISEIGIVTDEPLKLADSLIKENQLYYFSKGPKRPDFAALGDDNGLIVISNPDRNWYPTNDRAEKHYLKMILEAENKLINIEVIKDFFHKII